MNSNSVTPSNFSSDSYSAASCTKGPDDIYVNQHFTNFLDSNCTHFEQKNTQFEESSQEYQEKKKQQQRRHYLKWTDIEAAAANKYRNYGEGITYEDILKLFPGIVKSSGQAQDLLRNHKSEGKLYTCHRTKPQQYFLSREQAELASFNHRKSTYSDPIGVRAENKHSLPNPSRQQQIANALESAKIRDFYHALLMLKVAPLAMHNIRLYLKLTDPKRYHVIPSKYEEENRARVIRQRKGEVRITYKVYPHGVVEIITECSKAAFPIETDFDITKLFSFVGEIRNTLQGWLHDVNDHMIPPVEEWRLVHADISKDVKVPERLHVTVPNMELNVADRVLRMYVKTLNNESVLRLEEMRIFDEAFGDAVNSLRKDASSSSTTAMVTHSVNPAAFVEIAEQNRKIAMLTSQMAEMQEMMVESRKLAAQEIGVKKDTICSEQIAVYHKEKEQVDNTEKSVNSNDDGCKLTQFNNRLSITPTNSAKVENNKMKTLEMQQQQQQQQQQPIAIPPFTTPNDDIPIIMSSAAELLEQRNNSSNHLRISTGSKRLDDLLGGGIERGALTEIVGSSGTGKTQLCLTLSVTTQQQEQNQKQQKASVNGGCETATPSSRVLFIDTKKTFDRRRICSIAQARGLDPDHAVESITIETIQNFQTLQEFIFEKLEEFFFKNPDTVLVIVDSMTALEPTPHKVTNDDYLSLWQQSLDSLMYSLHRVALENDIAVVVINDTETVRDCPFEQTRIQIGENIILRGSTYRLNFKNYDSYKVARIVHSPYHPEGNALFSINGEGIMDVQP